jgi:hypothetical protein
MWAAQKVAQAANQSFSVQIEHGKVVAVFDKPGEAPPPIDTFDKPWKP